MLPRSELVAFVDHRLAAQKFAHEDHHPPSAHLLSSLSPSPAPITPTLSLASSSPPSLPSRFVATSAPCLVRNMLVRHPSALFAVPRARLRPAKRELSRMSPLLTCCLICLCLIFQSSLSMRPCQSELALASTCWPVRWCVPVRSSSSADSLRTRRRANARPSYSEPSSPFLGRNLGACRHVPYRLDKSGPSTASCKKAQGLSLQSQLLTLSPPPGSLTRRGCRSSR